MAMEFSIKDIADIIEVSKTTVRKAIQKENIKYDCIKNNKQLYNEEKAKQIILFIKADFDFANSQFQFANSDFVDTNSQPKAETSQIKTENSQSQSGNSQSFEMQLLQRTIDILEKQLEQKDKQIDDLNARLEQALSNAREQSHEHNYITATDKQKQLIEAQAEGIEKAKDFEEAEPIPKKSIFAKLFNK